MTQMRMQFFFVNSEIWWNLRASVPSQTTWENNSRSLARSIPPRTALFSPRKREERTAESYADAALWRGAMVNLWFVRAVAFARLLYSCVRVSLSAMSCVSQRSQRARSSRGRASFYRNFIPHSLAFSLPSLFPTSSDSSLFAHLRTGTRSPNPATHLSAGDRLAIYHIMYFSLPLYIRALVQL